MTSPASSPEAAAPEAPAPLARRLPRADPAGHEAAAALRERGDCLERDDPAGRLVLHADGAAPPATTANVVRLACGTGDALLVQELARNVPKVGDFAWQDLAGEARLLAWALAHESLLAALSAALGQSLAPTAFASDEGSPGGRQWVRVAFTRPDGDAEWRGLLGLDAEGVRALAGANGWRFDEEAAARRRGRIALPCELHAQAPRLPLAELRALATGDVLLLGTRAAVFGSLRLVVPADAPQTAGSVTWGAKWSDGALTLGRRFAKDAGMADDPPEPQAPTAAQPEAVPTGSPMSALPVQLDVLIGAPRLTVGEVEKLAAGQVIPLGQSLEHAAVQLRANGADFARGELVALGDSLGVRIVSIDDSG